MDDNRLQSHSRDDNLEIHPNPTFRQRLGHSATSRLFGTHSVDKRSTIQYTPAQTRDDADINVISSPAAVEKRPPHHSYESVDTLDKPATTPETRVYWKGLPAWMLTWELLGIVISVLFLVLGACVARLKGQTESEWSKRVIQATRIAPSIWPILFSGVMGNAVRRFASWRAERGIRLLALEQLMSSMTMAGSILAVFTWSIFQLSSLVLIILWAFNPLGSQASFRGVYLTDNIGYGLGNISYYNHSLNTQMDLSMFLSGSRGSSRTKPMIRALYSAALYDALSTLQYVGGNNATYLNKIMTLGGHQAVGIQAATDSWGNLRIPSIEYLSAYDPAHPDAWIEVPWQEQPQNYSSLVGDRFDGLDRGFTGNTTFNMTSSYQHLSCSPWLAMGANQSLIWAEKTYGQNLTALFSNDFSAPIQMPVTGNVYRSFLGLSSSVQTPHWNLSAPGHPKFVFASMGSDTGDEGYLYVTECGTETTYVDVQVSCMSKGASGKANCGVDAIRKTLDPIDLKGGFLEALRVDNMTVAGQYTENVARGFLWAFTDIMDDNQVGSAVSSIIERYIYDPLTAFEGTVTMGYIDLGSLDIKLVEQRLSLLYNTLWKIGWSYRSMSGGNMTTSYNKSETIDDELVTMPVYTLLNVTSQTVRPLEPTYALDMPWLLVYFVSVGVMFLAAVASLVLHAKCSAPPILGYVSSLIRDSVFFSDNGVQGNSTEGGSSKASRLGKMEVKISDVWSGESVGRVAFAPGQGRGVVKKERWYD